jgi:hypothetical protein
LSRESGLLRSLKVGTLTVAGALFLTACVVITPRALPPPPAPGAYIVKNDCSHPVRLSEGDPKLPGARQFEVAPFALVSQPWKPGLSLWLLDAAGNALAGTAVPDGQRRVVVPPTCIGIRAYPTFDAAPVVMEAPPPPPPPPPPAPAPVPLPPPTVTVVPPPGAPMPPPPAPPVGGPPEGSFLIQSQCDRPVRIFIDGDPSLGRGTFLDVPPLATLTQPWSPGLNIWVVNQRNRGISSVTIPPHQRRVLITRACIGLRTY